MAELERENEELRNTLLYLRAEIENLRKLIDKEVEMAGRRAVESLLIRLIEIYEGLERAVYSLSLGGENEPETLVSGLRLIHREMGKLLNDEGVVFMETVGKKFDPFIHEAVGFVENEELEEGTITAEVSRGYEYRGRILKAPRVIVSKRKEKGQEKSVDA